jgi:hypothetical protein
MSATDRSKKRKLIYGKRCTNFLSGVIRLGSTVLEFGKSVVRTYTPEKLFGTILVGIGFASYLVPALRSEVAVTRSQKTSRTWNIRPDKKASIESPVARSGPVESSRITDQCQSLARNRVRGDGFTGDLRRSILSPNGTSRLLRRIHIDEYGVEGVHQDELPSNRRQSGRAEVLLIAIALKYTSV